MSEMVINNQTVNCVETATATEKKANAWEIIKAVRYFLPILSSIGAAIIFFVNHESVFFGLGGFLVLIGTLSAITCCPLKLLAFPFVCIPAGFSLCRGFIPFYGVADLVAAIFGTIGGFMFGLLTVAFVPAFFTIKKFFEIKD